MSSRRPMKYQNLQRTGCNRHCDLGFHHLVSLHHKLSTALWKCFNIDVQYWVVFILKVTKQINPGRWLNTEGLLSYPIWNQSRNRKIISLSCWNNISCHSLVTNTLLPTARASLDEEELGPLLHSALQGGSCRYLSGDQPSLHRNMILDQYRVWIHE